MVKIEFTICNAAYRTEDNEIDEYAIAESIYQVADAVKNYRLSGPIFDYNGNKVGYWEVKDND